MAMTGKQETSTVLSATTPIVPRQRHLYADNMKVVLVIGVIVGHVTMAWTGVGEWVFDEPPVREPLLSVLILVSVIGALFAIPLFFLIAGAFTPGSLERKGLGRFCIDRIVRLGLPMLFFIVFLSPIVEYVDPDNAGWGKGFGAFTVHIWWPPAPGPTWFLGVLLVFSIGYALVRVIWPRRGRPGRTPPRLWLLATVPALIALASYAVRLVVPLGAEVWRLALGQSPAWLAGFVLGVLGAERGWYHPIDRWIGRIMRRVAWTTVAFFVLFIGTGMALEVDINDFAGGGTWQSLVTAGVEGVLVVTMSFWLLDMFQRRLDHQGRLAREMSRSAYMAFVLHQVILVGLVLATHYTDWPPEIEYAAVAVLGVAGSFGLASILLKLPGVSRVL